LIDADPTAGQYRERRTLCTAADWMSEAAKVKPTVPTQIGKRADEVLSAVVAAVPRQPRFISFDVADSVFPYALDSTRSRSMPALTEIQRICQSEPGYCYLRGGLNADGLTLRFEKRSARLIPLPVASFIGTMQGLSPSASLRNKAKCTAHPRRVDTLDTIVL